MNSSSKEIDELILNLKHAFNGTLQDQDIDFKWKLLKKLCGTCEGQMPHEISSNYYTILSFLLDALKPTLFRSEWEERLYDDFFLKGVNHDSFMILVRQLSNCSPSYKQVKILNLLQKFLRGPNLQSLLLYQSVSSEDWNLKVISVSKFWNELISLLVSLPERVANQTKGNMDKIFASTFYIPLLTSTIIKVLATIQEKIVNCEDCSLQFLGMLIGRLCSAGHGEVAVKKLATDIIKFSEEDYVWRRISQNLISKIPSNLLEPFVTQLLLVVPWYGYLDWIFGDAIVTNSKLNYILTEKLLFIRHFTQSLILQNVIGHLGSSDNRKAIFFKVFDAVLRVWSDGSVIKHQSFPQQYYIASALLIYSGWIKNAKDNSQSKCYMDKVLQGVQIRIGNSEESVRNLGMIVGESLTSALDPEAPKLEFEFPCSEMLNQLKALTKVPKKPEDMSLLISELKCFEEVELEKSKWETKPNPPQETKITEELDSDDDLEPYDMSNDVCVEDSQRPLYLRDCMLGLIEKDKPEWTEQCLKHAESLIRSHVDVVLEIAVEMTTVLLHLEDSFSTPDFIGLRHRAMIALAVLCPIQVAKYLTSQFYERDYNIRQRLDILEVLASSSQELSQLKHKLTDNTPQYSKSKFITTTEQSWKVVVEERIEAKTRRFIQGPKGTPEVPEENKFVLVAGFFFFPLLEKYDRESKMLNLLGDDSYVLGRLLYTLGIIMYSAANIPLSRQMGLEFLKFLTAVRNSPDVFVRQAAIFSLASVYLSVPASLLLSDLQNEAFESQRWLQDVIEKDTDIECQIRASKALALFINIMKQEMPQVI